MKIIISEILAFLSIYTYNLFLIYFYGKVVGFKLNKIISLVFFPIIITTVTFSMIVNLVFYL